MIFLLAMVLGLIPAMIAKLKGRSFFIWWVYGSLLFIFALPHAIFAKRLKQCSACKEHAQIDATLCPHCSTPFPALT